MPVSSTLIQTPARGLAGKTARRRRRPAHSAAGRTFSSSSYGTKYLLSRVLPCRFWTRMKRCLMSAAGGRATHDHRACRAVLHEVSLRLRDLRSRAGPERGRSKGRDSGPKLRSARTRREAIASASTARSSERQRVTRTLCTGDEPKRADKARRGVEDASSSTRGQRREAARSRPPQPARKPSLTL